MQESKKTIRDLIHRSFRWNVLVTYALMTVVIGTLFSIHLFNRITETERAANNFLKQNEEYLLSLALYHNSDAITLFLENENRRSDLLRYNFLPPGIIPTGAGLYPLSIGDKPQGYVHYAFSVARLVDPRILALIFLAATGLIWSTFRFYRWTQKALQEQLAAPLGQMADIAREARELSELSNIASVHSQIEEISLIRTALIDAAEKIQSAESDLREAQVAKALGDVASQVSHDIRSPLMALDVALSDVDSLPPERRVLVRSALGRIRDIANNLLDRGKKTELISSQAEICHVHAVLDRIVSEKHYQYRSLPGVRVAYETDREALRALARINATDFSRVVSNLINNAVEALDEHGTVSVSIQTTEDGIAVAIQDDGKGIPAEILAKIGQKGFTHGKQGTSSGSGLGVFHARSVAEAWGGSLEIESDVGKGTRVILRVPPTVLPSWYADGLRLPSDARVIVVDDDPAYGPMWEKLLSRPVMHFRDATGIRRWTGAAESLANAVFLFDHDLGNDNPSGLSLIEELALSEHTYLVTSRFDEKKIQDSCARLGVKLVPKGLERHLEVQRV